MKIVERRGSNDLYFLSWFLCTHPQHVFFGRVEIDLQKKSSPLQHTHPFHCLPIAEFVLFAPRYIQRDAQGIQPAISRKKITSFAIFTGFFCFTWKGAHASYTPVGSGQFERCLGDLSMF